MSSYVESRGVEFAETISIILVPSQPFMTKTAACPHLIDLADVDLALQVSMALVVTRKISLAVLSGKAAMRRKAEKREYAHLAVNECEYPTRSVRTNASAAACLTSLS